MSSATNSLVLAYVKCKFFLAVGLIVAVASVANAQTNTPASPPEGTSNNFPEFEVATIKPIDPKPEVMHETAIHVYPGGRLVITNLSLKSLIAAAFDINYWQVSGGSDWMEKERYDVEAEAPRTSQSALIAPEYAWYTLRNKQMQLMLQALLIERFRLKFHRETRTSTVFILEKSGKTLKLHPTDATAHETSYPSGDIGRAGGRGWSGHDTAMSQLAKFLSSYILHCSVVDQTGLDGYFDFESDTIQTNSDIHENDPTDTSSSFLAVVKEIGLRLKSTKGPVETLVVDHIEKPSPN